MFKKIKKLYFKIYHLFKLISVFLIFFSFSSFVNADTLPSDYVEVPYIQSDGSQYIDTGIKANSTINITIVTKCYYSFAGDGCKGLFGGGVAWQNNYLQGEMDSFPYFAYGNQTYAVHYNGSSSQFYTVQLNNNIAYINNVVYKTFSSSTWSTNYNIVLFAVNRSDVISEYGYYQIQSCVIYDNNILVRQFVPVYQYSSDSYGLYDIVSSSFFSNKGTGSFTTDPNFTPPTPPTPPTPEPIDDIFSDFLAVFTDRFIYLTDNFTSNPYLFTFLVIIFSFIILELFFKFIYLKGGRHR